MADAKFPSEPPTGVVCPACEGERMSIEEDGTNVRGMRCELCEGVGIVSVSRMREYKIGLAFRKPREPR